MIKGERTAAQEKKARGEKEGNLEVGIWGLLAGRGED